MREIQKLIGGVPVYIDEECKNWDAVARRPYYRLRGKRISEEQAFEIIRRTDNFFSYELRLHDGFEDYGYQEWNDYGDWGEMGQYIEFPECLGSLNFDMWWFHSNHSPEKYGWCQPDGVLGINAIMQMYPNISELIEEWTIYIREFPYLDLVIGITRMNESCSERHDLQSELLHKHMEIGDIAYRRQMQELCMSDLEYQHFFDWMDVGVWVHDGILEIMNRQRTAEVYKSYEAFEEPDKRIYLPEFNQTFRPDIVTRDYLHRCIRAYGIQDPEALIQEKTQPYVTRNIK